MIYVGLIHFNDSPDRVQDLCSALEFYTKIPPTVINKNSLTLVYGKLLPTQDVDKIWENESSILVGRIFDKANKTSFGEKDFKNLSSLSKEAVLEKVWGRYIYIQANTKRTSFDIVIDSTGQLPFFYYAFPNGNVLFASDIEILLKALGQKPEYNWIYLCSYLIYGNSSAIQTPFKNIFELPPACCLKIIKDERKTEPFWNPLSAYKKKDVQGKDAASVLQDTLKPWIEPYQNICVSLSGGLDSSSLVYCLRSLKKENQTLNAINCFHSQIKSSNELIHARKVAQETGIELIEIDVSNCLPFDPPHYNPLLRPNKPIPALVNLKWIESIWDHIPLEKSCAFFSGHGSDHIFMCPPSKKAIADYILEKGLKGSKEPCKNITLFYRDSLFPILKENMRSLVSYFLSLRLDKRHPKNIQDERPDWIKKELLTKTSIKFVHPIYETLSKKILPGKYDQIDSLFEGLASIHMGMNPIFPIYYPYLYEPVVHFALSFPVYDLFRYGYDRYPLRKAISDRFNTETVWRRDKSHTMGVFQLGIKKNLESVLTLCLEGQFVKLGLIDKEGLCKTIKLISKGDTNCIWPLTHLASCEIFLKQWEEARL